MSTTTTGSLNWKKIYSHSEVSNAYLGYAEETWECNYKGGTLVRHVRYDLNEGDESNHTTTMIFVPPQEMNYDSCPCGNVMEYGYEDDCPMYCSQKCKDKYHKESK